MYFSSHPLAFSPSLVLHRIVEARGETNRIRVPYARRPIESIDANCLPSYHPGRLSTHSFIELRPDTIETRLLWLLRISQLASLRTPSSRVISDWENSDECCNTRVQIKIIFRGRLETLVDKSQRSCSACDEAYEFISKLGNCRISINNWCALRAGFGPWKKNMAKLLVFVKLQKAVVFMYG